MCSKLDSLQPKHHQDLSLTSHSSASRQRAGPLQVNLEQKPAEWGGRTHRSCLMSPYYDADLHILEQRRVRLRSHLDETTDREQEKTTPSNPDADRFPHTFLDIILALLKMLNF